MTYNTIQKSKSKYRRCPAQELLRAKRLSIFLPASNITRQRNLLHSLHIVLIAILTASETNTQTGNEQKDDSGGQFGDHPLQKMKKILKVVKERVTRLQDFASKSGWKRGLFVARKHRKPRKDCAGQRTISDNEKQIPTQALPKPETYVPTGAPWRVEKIDHLRIDLSAGTLSNQINDALAEHKAISVPTWVAEAGVQCRYVDGGSRLIQATDGINMCVALLASAHLFDDLQKAVLENRALRKSEVCTDTELDELHQESESLGRQILRLGKQVAELMKTTLDTDDKQLRDLREKLRSLRKRQAKIEDSKRSTNHALENKWKDQRGNLHLLLTAFDKILIDSKVLQPDSDEDSEDDISVASEYHAEIPGEVATVYRAYSQAKFSRIPFGPDSGHSKGHDKKRMAYTGSGDGGVRGLNANVKDPAMPEPDLEQYHRDHLSFAFRMNRARLCAAEARLDNREDCFDQQADERHRKIAAGEEVETQTEFDLRQFRDTQLYTHNIIEAEAAYDKAKAAAVAGGVQVPGSEIESGFVDDPADGYKASSEDDTDAPTDPAAILSWMFGLPEDNTWETSEAPERVETKQEQVDSAGWDAESIEIWDSRSMVAEDPWRRRIDKWRSTCGLV